MPGNSDGTVIVIESTNNVFHLIKKNDITVYFFKLMNMSYHKKTEQTGGGNKSPCSIFDSESDISESNLLD